MGINHDKSPLTVKKLIPSSNQTWNMSPWMIFSWWTKDWTWDLQPDVRSRHSGHLETLKTAGRKVILSKES